MPNVKVNGINLHYEEHITATSKEPLLMIMGLTFSLLDWGDDLPNELAKFYRVIVFDNRASGESDTPPGSFTIVDMADDAAGLLSALKISSAHVFGISMGGMIAQELALNHPKLVQKLILGCTACRATFSSAALDAFISPGSGDPPIWPLLFTEDFIKKNRTSLSAFWKKVEPHHSKDAAYRAQLAAVSRHDACDRLSTIVADTLILTGDDDPVIDPSNSKDLASKIPTSRLATLIKDARHGFPYSHWKETVTELTGFLK